MICFPQAKINLGLRILDKRTDGYHNIETVFYPIPLCDILEIVPSGPANSDAVKVLDFRAGGSLYLTRIGNSVDCHPRKDLTVKACEAFDQKFGISGDRHLILYKHIPSGAGLGGGSSDAASSLLLLNKLENSIARIDELREIAAGIGSDCAFFIEPNPSIAHGRGEILQSLEISLSGLYLMLIQPPVHVSTAAAYAGVDLSKARSPVSLSDLPGVALNEWSQFLKNDFESSVFLDHPVIGLTKQLLYDAGAVYASMSGSGSSVFGLFNELPLQLELENGFKQFIFQLP